MAYLDLSITALRERPEDFEQKGRRLLHVPSRHGFKFDSKGNVRLRASCDCALLTIGRQQGRELWRAFQDWHQAYWRPTVINRQFILHFRWPNLWRRLIRAVISRLDESHGVHAERFFAPPPSGLVRERVRSRLQR